LRLSAAVARLDAAPSMMPSIKQQQSNNFSGSV